MISRERIADIRKWHGSHSKEPCHECTAPDLLAALDEREAQLAAARTALEDIALDEDEDEDKPRWCYHCAWARQALKALKEKEVK
jgi:hypothetical protein